MFPETRLFQAEGTKDKVSEIGDIFSWAMLALPVHLIMLYTAHTVSSTIICVFQRYWLDILDATKRKKAALDAQRKEAAQQAAKDRQSAASLDPTNRQYRIAL